MFILLISNHTVFLVQFGINLHLWVFQKAEIALAEAARAISTFWKTHSCKLIPNWTRNRMITYTNCAIACGTHAYIAARIFADVAQGRWRPKFPKSFMLLAHNSTPSWLLEFCFSIFVAEAAPVSVKTVPNLGMSRFISLIKLSPAALFTRTSHFHIWRRN